VPTGGGFVLDDLLIGVCVAVFVGAVGHYITEGTKMNSLSNVLQ
jgi:hypothetical protein